MHSPTDATLSPHLQLTVRGDVARRHSAHALRKIGAVLRGARGTRILHAHVVVELARDPARARPAAVQVHVDVDGTPVRVHVSASDVHAAADLAADRLQQRLVHLRDRHLTRHRWLNVTTAGHRRAPDPHYASLLEPAERQTYRCATLAPEPLTPDEAAYDMELLDHDFLLFTDAESGQDAVLCRRTDGRYGLHGHIGRREWDLTAVPLVLEGPLLELTDEQAREHLDLADERYVYYRDPADERGRVMYRRLDGHYGIVTPRGAGPGS